MVEHLPDAPDDGLGRDRRDFDPLARFALLGAEVVGEAAQGVVADGERVGRRGEGVDDAQVRVRGL